MKKLFLILFLSQAIFCSLATAEINPSRSPYDSRVRIIDYNALDVVKISTFYGVSTHVQFADDETIKDIAIGDDQAWNIVPRANHLFIKPKAKKADTNITIITNKRVYNFAIVVVPRSAKDESAWKDPNLVYALSFKYPDEEAKKLAAEKTEKERKDELKRRWETVKSKFAKVTNKNGQVTGDNQIPVEENQSADDYVGKNEVPLEQQNYDYWMAGSEEIAPTAVRDDKRFTYLAFNNNRDMPAVYSVDAAGKEALINTNVEGNTIIVHRVVPLLRLRKGDAVVCIRNDAFDYDGGIDNLSGTIAPDIERVIKSKGAQ